MAEDSSVRPLAVTPEHKILDKLEDLRSRLNNTRLEKYDYFIRHSDMHRACTYALKCKALFFMSDFQEIREQIRQVEEIMRNWEDNGYREED